MTARTERRAGFTLVEIMIVVAIIGMLATMAIPFYVKARTASQASACVNNLRQIDGAKDVFAIENGSLTGAGVTDADVNPYLKQSMAELVEPAGGTYTLEPIGTSPTCSIGGLHVLD